MKIMRSVAMTAIVSALATPALADRQETVYITPFAGFQLFDDKRDLSESGTFGVGVEYRFTPHWAIEAVYSRGEADRKYVAGDSDFDEIRLDGTYYLAPPDRAWNPYVSLGAGHANFGTDDSAPRTAGTAHDETRVNLGTGVRYNISDMVSVRGDLREFHGIDESTFDTQVSLGISVAFGRTIASARPTPPPPPPADTDGDGVPDSRDACPGTPANADVDARGCELDSDGDGVVNSQDRCPSTRAGAVVDESGCEGIAEVIETFDIEVRFATNSAEITSQFDADIRRVADFLKAHPETFVEIAGHTDSTGNAAYNQRLSQQRAEAVADRLIRTLGVDPARVQATGYGEEQPIASNSTAAGRAANRRVEARIQVRR